MYALAWACCAGMTWRVTCTDIHVDIDRAPSAQIFSLPPTSMGWCWLVLSRLVPISGREQVDPNPYASPLSHVVVSLGVRLGRRDLQQRVWGKNMEVLLALHSIPLPKSQQNLSHRPLAFQVLLYRLPSISVACKRHSALKMGTSTVNQLALAKSFGRKARRHPARAVG